MKKIIVLLVVFVLVISFAIKNYYLSGDDREVILDYLDNKLIPPSFGGNFTSSFKLLGTGDGEIYIWAQLQEYYHENGKLEKGTGMSAPVVLIVEQSGKQLEVIGDKQGRTGYYVEYIKENFPRRLRHKIETFPESTRRIERLGKDIEERLNN